MLCVATISTPDHFVCQKLSSWHGVTRTHNAPRLLADAQVFFLALAMTALHDTTLSEHDRSRIGLALILSFILLLSAAMVYVWLSVAPLLVQERRERRRSTRAAVERACRCSRESAGVETSFNFPGQPAEPTSTLFANPSGEGGGDRGSHADSKYGGGPVADSGQDLQAGMAAWMERRGGTPEHSSDPSVWRLPSRTIGHAARQLPRRSRPAHSANPFVHSPAHIARSHAQQRRQEAQPASRSWPPKPTPGGSTVVSIKIPYRPCMHTASPMRNTGMRPQTLTLQRTTRTASCHAAGAWLGSQMAQAHTARRSRSDV
jgi:hypothetical protein